MGSSQIRRRIGKSSTQKLRLVAESYRLKGSKFGAFLRSEGIKSLEIERWRNQMVEGLESNIMMNVDTKKSYQKKIAKLERELNEARVIIELQKKAQKILADEEKNTAKRSVKNSARSSTKDSGEE